MNKKVTIELTIEELKEVKKAVQDAFHDEQDCGYWDKKLLGTALFKISCEYNKAIV